MLRCFRCGRCNLPRKRWEPSRDDYAAMIRSESIFVPGPPVPYRDRFGKLDIGRCAFFMVFRGRPAIRWSYAAGTNWIQTGDGTERVWPLGVRRPEDLSTLKTTIVSES